MLLVGLAGFFAIWGTGLWLWTQAQLQTPWHGVIGAVSGILIFGPDCQVIAMAAIARQVDLTAYLLVWLATGEICRSRQYNRWHELPRTFHPCGMSEFFGPVMRRVRFARENLVHQFSVTVGTRRFPSASEPCLNPTETPLRMDILTSVRLTTCEVTGGRS